MSAAARTVCVVILGMQTLATCAATQQTFDVSERLRFPPNDESSNAPGFRAFISRFRKAVDDRDVKTVLVMTSPEIGPSPFGDDSRQGREAFRKYRRLDDRQSEFWSVVPRLLEKGGAVQGCDEPRDQCRVSYPFWNARVPLKFDGFDHFVVQHENVALYEVPSTQGRVVEKLSYELVRRVIDQTKAPTEGWQQVALLDGRKGFVQVTDLHSLVGYRMTFARLPDGNWMLWSFISGD